MYGSPFIQPNFIATKHDMNNRRPDACSSCVGFFLFLSILCKTQLAPYGWFGAMVCVQCTSATANKWFCMLEQHRELRMSFGHCVEHIVRMTVPRCCCCCCFQPIYRLVDVSSSLFTDANTIHTHFIPV